MPTGAYYGGGQKPGERDSEVEACPHAPRVETTYLGQLELTEGPESTSKLIDGG